MYHGHVPLRSFSDVLSHSPLTGKAQFLGPVTVIKSFKLRLRSQRHQLLPSSCLRNRERRFFHVPSVLYPPVTFLGLAALLWSYKCLVMVIFQNKIIYMPSVPPFSRSEDIADYATLCLPVVWREGHMFSRDGTKLGYATSQLASTSSPRDISQQVSKTVVIYFHGNGGSVPPRLPSLSAVLKRLRSSPGQDINKTTIMAISYRGYWTSSGRASERGIRLDAEAVLLYAQEKYPNSNVILWGQSLGAAAALHAASKQSSQVVSGLILETPFVSIRAMLTALYPQIWLPYRYLGPFLWNHWDSVATFRNMHDGWCSKVLILQAGKDELVPPSHMDKIALAAKSRNMDVRTLMVRDALHNDVVGSHEGKKAIVAFIEECSHSTK